MNLSRRLEAPLSGTEMQHNDYKDTDYTIYKVLLLLLRDSLSEITWPSLVIVVCKVQIVM